MLSETSECLKKEPYFDKRIALRKTHNADISMKPEYVEELSKHPIEYFRKFYADTSTIGSTPALMCGYSFFGSENLLFGSDMPYGTEGGEPGLRQVISSIESMGIPWSDKEKIFKRNAKRILHLPDYIVVEKSSIIPINPTTHATENQNRTRKPWRPQLGISCGKG